MSAAASGVEKRREWRRRAEQVNDAFGLVLAMVLLTYVLGSLLVDPGWDEVVLIVVASLTSVVALIAAHSGERAVRAALGVTAIATAGAVASALGAGSAWIAAAGLLTIAVLSLAMLGVLRRVLTAPSIGSRTILGALSFYAVLGILFSFAYNTVSRIQDGDFFVGVADARSDDFLFFSYTTLTTTGYGNLVPAEGFGRMLAGLEMMAGQIFLVTLVAGLVSLWRPGERLRQRRAERPQG